MYYPTFSALSSSFLIGNWVREGNEHGKHDFYVYIHNLLTRTSNNWIVYVFMSGTVFIKWSLQLSLSLQIERLWESWVLLSYIHTWSRFQYAHVMSCPTQQRHRCPCSQREEKYFVSFNFLWMEQEKKIGMIMMMIQAASWMESILLYLLINEQMLHSQQHPSPSSSSSSSNQEHYILLNI